MVKDPVCGMQVDEKKAGATSAHKGTTYHFCSPACKTKFDTTPEKFTGKGATPAGKLSGDDGRGRAWLAPSHRLATGAERARTSWSRCTRPAYPSQPLDSPG